MKAAASPSEERPGGLARSTVAGRSQQPVLANACEKAVLIFTSDNTLEYSSLEQPVRTSCKKLEYSGVDLPVKLQPVRTSCNLRTSEAVQTWLVGNAEVKQRSVLVDQRSPLDLRSCNAMRGWQRADSVVLAHGSLDVSELMGAPAPCIGSPR